MSAARNHCVEALAIIIVSYRSMGSIGPCLRSLELGGLLPGLPGDLSKPEVIVVDSGSDDGTPEYVASAFPGVVLVRSPENVGFARGVNLGLQVRSREDALLLNPDTLCPSSTILGMHSYLLEHPGVAAVGPALHGVSGDAQVSTQHFPSVRSELSRQWERIARAMRALQLDREPPTSSEAVDWVSGACLLIRGRALACVGTLDERFFLYFEETDWCRRASQAGWQVHFLPALHCEHVGGVSARAGDARVRAGQVARHFRRSRHQYFRKHHGFAAAYCVGVLHAARSFYVASCGALQRRGVSS
jgi:N-acetylglucosaminyl-diphospho-decaprenol L-rhamnosyltransferase